MKRFLSILFAAMMGLSLVACGSDSASKKEDSSISQTSYDKNDLGSILSAVTAEGETAIQTISDDSITFFMVRGPRGIEFIKHKYYDIYLSMAIEQVTGSNLKFFLPTPILQHRSLNLQKLLFLQNILVI
mgnify:CR=1 FL=1